MLGKTAAHQEGYRDATAYLKEKIKVQYKMDSYRKNDPIYSNYWSGWNKAIDDWLKLKK